MAIYCPPEIKTILSQMLLLCADKFNIFCRKKQLRIVLIQKCNRKIFNYDYNEKINEIDDDVYCLFFFATIRSRFLYGFSR